VLGQLDNETSVHADPLRRAISEAKGRLAELVGTSPDRVKLIIEI
jgi:hypothetical protein